MHHLSRDELRERQPDDVHGVAAAGDVERELGGECLDAGCRRPATGAKGGGG